MSNPFKDLGHQINHVAHDAGNAVVHVANDVSNKVVDAAESAAAQAIVDSAVEYLATDGVVIAEDVAIAAL
jgi:hypothetical protein